LPLLTAVRNIDGLDADRGLALSANSQEKYLRLLRVSVNCLDTNIERANGLLESGNLRDFAIELHGMKGALYNIGANTLGDMAFYLESTGKRGDAERCAGTFPIFTASISSFLTRMRGALKDDGPKLEGSVRELALALPGARDACKRFNMLAALDIITPLAKFVYAPDIEAHLHKIEALMNAMEYDEAIESISALMDVLEKIEP
jgi:HPt (histidine-containing phosphotransfer) domain-containing protein